MILFEDGTKTSLTPDKVIFRKINDDDMIFEHRSEPPGNFVLELNKEIVATGGSLLHYNFPFADLYMEVKEEYRRKGFGSFIISKEIRKRMLSCRKGSCGAL